MAVYFSKMAATMVGPSASSSSHSVDTCREADDGDNASISASS